jgi:hypothetical protein
MFNDYDDDDSYNSMEDMLGCSVDRFLPNNAVTCVVCHRKGFDGDFEDHNICFKCHGEIFEEGLDEETKEAVLRELRLFQNESPAATSTTASAASVDKSNSNKLIDNRCTPMATNTKQQQPKRKTLQNPKNRGWAIKKEPPVAVASSKKWAIKPIAIKKEPPVAVASSKKWATKPVATKKAPPPVIVNPYAKKKKPVSVKPHSKLSTAKRSKAKSSVLSIGHKGQKQFIMYG